MSAMKSIADGSSDGSSTSSSISAAQAVDARRAVARTTLMWRAASPAASRPAQPGCSDPDRRSA
jgi:hypothetical protein